ncbi:hypothetical protein DICVIV_03695 [Dictyocaulus viviparus]|uniref:Aminotransferase class I/classII domain-containing protein n=1 Tax=Dictyocaulus viviparus TaxID=29172 RepID=A0A0D8Y1T9_DICVI|nr:hypothetical protein DICVIV_03695 [Dictyocaulus viviparus]
MSTIRSTMCIDDFMRRKLEERTDILECAWNYRQDGVDEQSDNIDKFNPNHLTKIAVYFSWIVLLLFAYLRETLRLLGLENNKFGKERPEQQDFVPLYSDFESVYSRNCYNRVRDVFERPIASAPSSTVDLLDRISNDYNWTFNYPGTRTNVINVGSYNYLGFAQANGPCTDTSIAQIDKEGLATCSTTYEGALHEAVQFLQNYSLLSCKDMTNSLYYGKSICISR